MMRGSPAHRFHLQLNLRNPPYLSVFKLEIAKGALNLTRWLRLSHQLRRVMWD